MGSGLLPRGARCERQGRTRDEARASLIEAIALILEDRREDGLRGVPADAERETITVDIRGAA
jgi:predicted RNase H-like HicB family nuclease